MDFKVIVDKLSGARLIGIGESTHGTHEFFMSKVELFKILVKKHSFNTLMLEDSVDVCRDINNYIQTGKGDLSNVMKKLYSVWRVQELAELISWMKESNDQHNFKFVGFDVNQNAIDPSKRDELMTENIADYMNTNPNSRTLIWAHNTHIKVSFMNEGFKPMGMFLKNKFGKDYVAIAQFFGIGQFNATHVEESNPDSRDRTLRTVTVSNIPHNLHEYRLDKLSNEPYFLSKDEFNKKHLLSGSHSQVRSVGWGLVPRRLNEYVEDSNLAQEFDGLIYYPSTTASQLLI